MVVWAGAYLATGLCILNHMENKKLPSWQTLKKEIVFETPWLKLQHNEFVLPTGKKGQYHFVTTNGSVFVVPILDNGRIILGRQYRYLIDSWSYEFPGGGIKPGQTPEEAAADELEEELGYIAKELIPVGIFVPWNGVTDEKCHVFAARGLEPVKQKLEETESIDLVTYSKEELENLFKENLIHDGMTLAAWQLARPRLVGI